MSKQKILGKQCLEPQLPKSSALCNQASVWSTALVVLMMGEFYMGRCACHCCLIDQPPLTPPVSWVRLIHPQDLVGLDAQLWAGSACYKWQRPSLVGYVVFKPLCFAASLWDPSLRAHMHSYLSAFAEAVSIIGQMSQCLGEIITWLKRIRMQLFVDKTMWGWQEKAILQELNFCWGLFPMGCQCDAQTRVSAGRAISHEHIGGNVEEGLLLGLARSLCSFAFSEWLISAICLQTVPSFQQFSSFCLVPRKKHIRVSAHGKSINTLWSIL